MAVASTPGSPRSRPSEQITTMPPRHRPRRPQSRTNASSESPIRVPPSQSKTAFAARSSASSGRRCSSSPCDPGQPGAEAEDLDPRRGALGRVGELQQVARVVRHRPGDVEDQDQRPQPQPATSPEQLGRLAVRAHRLAHRPAHVRSATRTGADGAPRAPARRGQPDPLHDLAQGRELVRRAGGERLVPQRVGVGGHQPSRASRSSTVPTGLDSGRAPAAPTGPRARARIVSFSGSAGPSPSSRKNRREDAVVHRDLVVAGDQGGAPGPVEVEQVGRVERRHGCAVGQDVAGADRRGRPRAARGRSRRASASLDDRRRRSLRHRRRSARGCRAPARGRRAP